MENIKVIIVDDHQIIVDGLKSLLREEKDIKVIGEASNGKEAIDLVRLISPNVILIDIDMPVLNGIEATKLITKEFNEPKIIILSMHNEGSLIKTLINVGAKGYLLKNCDRSELVEAIRKIAGGQTFFSSDVTMSLLENRNVPTSHFTENNNIAELTEREIEILKLIAEGYSNKEIGDKLFISHRTVDTHRTNLMRKLEVNNIAGLVRFAISNGVIS